MAVSASWDDSADDRMSFEDSERFEDDSLCSAGSETESVGTLTWRGWRKSDVNCLDSPGDAPSLSITSATYSAPSLSELCAEVVAGHYPFEVVEQYQPPVPEQLQLRIAFYAFPKHEDDIRLYSCLANGSMSEFQKGEFLLKHKAVKNVLQIGFHLSGTVTQPQSYNQSYSVSASFDRGKIISCWCTCQSSVVWCAHVTAVCLLRIQSPGQVSLRAPVSESLSRLARDQLQKFAQYLINELPQQILPTAQKLLDELLSDEKTEINQLEGAPDPTAGASAGSVTSWCLDDEALRLNIRKILGRFSGPAPIAFVDMNNLYDTSVAPPAASQWTALMGPLRKKEPEGLWNLLFIVSDLLQSYDRNAFRILELLTEECLAWPQLIMWWVSSENEDILASQGRRRHNAILSNPLPSSDNAKFTSVRLLDELVKLWKLMATDPCLSPEDRRHLKSKLEMWHYNTVTIGRKGLPCDMPTYEIVRERFKGFKPAIAACGMNWIDKYQALGFTLEDFVDRKRDKDITPCLTAFSLVPAADLAEFVEQHCQGYLDQYFNVVEALNTHGFIRAARSLATLLASLLLKFLSCCQGDLPMIVLNRLCSLPAKIARITEILTSDPKTIPMAFQLALLGLTMPRGPAPTELQEVRLTDSEIALHSTLKAIPHSQAEISLVREKARGILSRQINRGGMALPLVFGLYAFEVLGRAELLAVYLSREKIMFTSQDTPREGAVGYEEDEILAYQVALSILDERSQASERQHPMLCEGNRRHRSDLALTLLWHYRDLEERVREILLTLLNRQFYDTVVLFERATEPRTEHEDSGQAHEMPFIAPETSSSFEEEQNEKGSETSSFLDNNSSDSSDSGNGGLGKEKTGCWRLPRSTAVSGGPKRSPKARFSKPSKSSRNKRSVKRFKSRDFTESDSDPQPVGTRTVPCVRGGTNVPQTHLLPSQYNCDSFSPAHSEVENLSLSKGLSGTDDGRKSGALKSDSSRGKQPIELAYAQGRSPSSDEDRLSLSSCPDLETNDSHLDSSRILETSFTFNDHTRDYRSLDDSRQNDVGNSLSDPLAFLDDRHPRSCPPSLSEPSLESLSGEESKPEKGTEISETIPQEDQAVVKRTSSGLCLLSEKAASEEKVSVLENSSERPEASIGGMEGKTSLAEEEELASILSELSVHMQNELETFGCVDDKVESLQEKCSDREREGNEIDQRVSLNEGSLLSSDLQNEEKAAAAEKETLQVASLPCGVEGIREPNSLVENFPSTSSNTSESVIRDPTPFTAVLALHGTSVEASGAKKKRGRSNLRSRPPDVLHVAAESFMLFELAKRVLHQSYGKDILCLISEDTGVSRLANRHRGLQLAAFEIGLFALGINNLATPNWMSRTYSSNVSWVTDEAIDLGSPALRLINEQWDGVLTPSEVIEIAVRAARSSEATLARTAAELALSCLPQANSLTPREIEQAIFLCKDQDSGMLERACASIESASRNGGVQPQLLFQIARQWHYLHERERDGHHEVRERILSREFPFPLQPSISSPAAVPAPMTNLQGNSGPPSFLFVTPQQFVQEQMHQAAQEIMALHHTLLYNPTASCSLDTPVSPWVSLYRCSVPSEVGSRVYLPQVARVPASQQLPYPNEARAFDTPRYLQNAYRVGMKALEGLAARMPDERAETKYAPSPPCSDDIRWLCALAASIGPAHLRQFCTVVVSAVSSPFLLHDLALESARHFALYNPAQLASHLRSPSVSPVVQKCLAIYTELVRHELVKLDPTGYDSFVELLRKTRSAFCMAPGGMAKFNDLLQMIRKAYPRKKELWQLIMVGLSRA